MLSLAAVRLRTVARNAARNRDWATACKAYRAYLDRRPGDAKGWVQYGHVAKEAGDIETAVVAYGRALDVAPQAAETWFHLSHACKRLGDRAMAIDCCARASALEPGFTKATDELIALGSRDSITSAPPGATGSAEPDLPYGSTVYAPSRYNAFRHDIAILAPPSGLLIAGSMTILIDARAAVPIDVRVTLASILDQVDPSWEAIVFAPVAIRDHSVASLAAIDRRIRFVPVDAPLPNSADAPHALMVGAGTILDRQAVSWFSFAMARTSCVALYCDHDRSIDDWRTGRTFARPVFYPMFDPDWQPALDDRPAAILVDQTRLPLAEGGLGNTHQTLCDAALIGTVGHVPLLLASRKLLAEQAEQAPPDPSVTERMAIPLATAAGNEESHDHSLMQRIQVVIQTRDQSAMLQSAIDSIRKCAARPHLLDITIVNNRSVEPATARLLERLRRRGAAVVALDEPFNWSRANNLAVETGTAPLLLFLNNDTEMLTTGWDDMLRHALVAADVGIVGATLLYPDRTIQHAGIIMGMGSGGPIHEGVGRPIAAGPDDRWRKRRSAAAVTGAFLAMRRDVFAAVSGFDELQFAIAFNDIDLCLRVRGTGLRVVMESDLLVIHHESKTRGMNVKRSQIAWDLDELGRLHDRWGGALFKDPAYNPHWTRTGQPFDGFRFPSVREIVRHIDLSARSAPWTPSTFDDEPAWW